MANFMFTTKEIATFYGKSDTAIKKWQKLADYPLNAHKDGKIDLKILNDWVISHFYGGKITATSMAEAKLRREIAKARRDELLTAELEGKLIRIEKVKQDLTFVLVVLRQRLLAWSKSLPPRLAMKDTKELYKIIKDEVWEILNELSKGIDNIKKQTLEKHEK